MDNLSLVQAVARRSFLPPLSEDQDLLQCGRIALWNAARRWDETRPFRPYACACIHNAMNSWAKVLNRWNTAPPEEFLGEAYNSEEEILDSLQLRTRIEAAWPPDSQEHLVLTSLAAGIPKERLAARLGRSTWDLPRLSRRAWEKVPPA